MPTALSLIESALRTMKADGLCNGDIGCGCGFDDLVPNGDECLVLNECQAAKFIRPTEDDPKYDPDCPNGYDEPVKA